MLFRSLFGLLGVAFEVRHAALRSLSRILGIAYNEEGIGRQVYTSYWKLVYLNQIIGVHSLAARPEETIDAVKQLWITNDEYALRNGCERLEKRSPVLCVYTHHILCCRKLERALDDVGKHRDMDGSFRIGHGATTQDSAAVNWLLEAGSHQDFLRTSLYPCPPIIQRLFSLRHLPVYRIYLLLGRCHIV